MLTDDAPRFSFKDAAVIVGAVFAGAVGWQSVRSDIRVEHDANVALSRRIDAMQAEYDRKGIADLPLRISNIERLMCVTDDVERKRACDLLKIDVEGLRK